MGLEALPVAGSAELAEKAGLLAIETGLVQVAELMAVVVEMARPACPEYHRGEQVERVDLIEMNSYLA
jgi:hypothetical protein